MPDTTAWVGCRGAGLGGRAALGGGTLGLAWGYPGAGLGGTLGLAWEAWGVGGPQVAKSPGSGCIPPRPGGYPREAKISPFLPYPPGGQN